MNEQGRNLTVREKLGYGIASIGDTIVYNIITVYGLFFLTDVAKVESVAAGAIVFTATIWNAVSVAIIGVVSDRVTFRLGRRLPFMFASVIPMMILVVMMFTAIEGSGITKIIYYTIVLALLWTAHSVYMVPYEALGAELTSDAQERTVLRSYARFCMSVGNIFGLIAILYSVGKLEANGLTSQAAWQITTVLAAIIGGSTLFATCVLLRKRALEIKNPPRGLSKNRLGKEYFEILKIKIFRNLLWITLCLAMASVFCSSNIVYFMKYNLGLDENLQSVVFFVLTACGMVLTPILAGASKRFGKKNVMATAYLFSGLALIVMGVVRISSLAGLCVNVAAFTVAISAYWQLSFSMAYDVSEVDEFENGRRREAAIMSLTKIFFKIFNAIAAQLFTLLLFAVGYNVNSQEQTAHTLEGIHISLTYIPAIFFIAAAIFVYRYPLSEKVHGELLEQLRKRRG